jgi:DNA-binding winged helix-turn-helix (wHTH) protein
MGIHTFDEYVLDEDRRELRRGVDAVSVEPQVFDVLLHLVRNRHRVVSNDLTNNPFKLKMQLMVDNPFQFTPS